MPELAMDDLLSRRLGCGADGDTRAADFCARLERHMEWTWLGHASVSLGWRVTWDTVRRVYCEARIAPQDALALRALARSRDWRLQNGATSLLHLLEQDEPENSILNAHHPDYILRTGCD